MAEEYLPVHPEYRVQGVKVDFALGYYDTQSEIPGSLQEHHRTPLCPLKGKKDDFLTCVPVEVKTASGLTVYSEAQLFVFASAMLQVVEKELSTQPEKTNQEPPVVVALSVHDHLWQYYIICRAADVRQKSEPTFLVYGPWPAGLTSTLLGVFKLVRFIDVLRNWVVKNWLTHFTAAAGNKE